MKTRTFLALALVLSFVLGGVAMAASVEPVLVDPWQSGDAAFECGQAGSDADFAYKVDEWDEDNGMDGLYDEAGNTITILNSTGATFDWLSNWPVDVVIVKAGTAALLYSYTGTDYQYGDTGLWAPENKDISHATFCFNEPDLCYQEETAWAAGERYVKRGNWATYFGYPNGPVDILAGQYMDAGYLTFGTPVDGYVDITITLENGFIFYYDMSDEVADDNLKVQDYDKAPNKNPAPGLFDWKDSILVGSTTATINVPVNDFYGVHLDVAYPVPCE
jgi:hypothetical protein